MAEAHPEFLRKTLVSPKAFTDAEIVDMAKKYGTPLFLIDEAIMRSKVFTVEDAFAAYSAPVRVAYSMRSNYSPWVVKTFLSEGVIFEIASPGELFFYLSCGGRAENAIYTSSAEGEGEFLRAMKSAVNRFTVSSFSGLTNLVAAAASSDRSPSVIIRVNPEVGVRLEGFSSFRQGRLGVPFNGGALDSAASLLKRVVSSSVAFEGFCFNLGPQIEDPSHYLHAIDKLEAFVKRMKRAFPQLELRTLLLGGGMPVCYDKPVPDPEQIAGPIVERLNAMAGALESPVELIVESGRFLVAEASVLVSRIINCKTLGDRRFVFVDSGYHLLPDVVLHRQPYPLHVVPRSKEVERYKVSLAGRLCDTLDIFPLGREANLNGATPGRWVVFRNVGAYSTVSSMPFHCQPKPPIVLRSMDGEFRLIRRGESIEELFSEEGGSPSDLLH